ncbi:hypothetical protein SAMN05216279_13119 [Pseudomonas oryzihabitans]|jgi:hypothetical protein|uniref:Uncharacterized protein n=1 Tax=Pseudomonas oryzihabitans TaxID=47885 RepID=A0A1G5PI19_9PSED|nr:hypothetical protein SAMN05216279_13119 [Pseudomonas psychrotolerans]
MRRYHVRLQRVKANAGPSAGFIITVDAVSSDMAKITAEARYPGYRCLSAPTVARCQ